MSNTVPVLEKPTNIWKECTDSKRLELIFCSPRDSGLFSFKGRIGRADYWITLMVLFEIWLVVGGIYYGLLNGPFLSTIGQWLVVIYVIFALWAFLAASAKRWHDVDKSGWNLLFFIPTITAPYVLFYNWFIKGTKGPNQFGDDPATGDLFAVTETSVWSFRGRIGRGSFAIRRILLCLGYAVAASISVIILDVILHRDADHLGRTDPVAISILAVIVPIALLFWIATQAKRWHDLDCSGWMALLNLTIIAIPLLMIFTSTSKGTVGPNRFDTEQL
jgi:uncharacterized membrane protein YhaH (DUF805 family)